MRLPSLLAWLRPAPQSTPSSISTRKVQGLLPATRCQSSGPLGALLSSPALDVRLLTALQVLHGHVRRREAEIVSRLAAIDEALAERRDDGGT